MVKGERARASDERNTVDFVGICVCLRLKNTKKIHKTRNLAIQMRHVQCRLGSLKSVARTGKGPFAVCAWPFSFFRWQYKRSMFWVYQVWSNNSSAHQKRKKTNISLSVIQQFCYLVICRLKTYQPREIMSFKVRTVFFIKQEKWTFEEYELRNCRKRYN